MTAVQYHSKGRYGMHDYHVHVDLIHSEACDYELSSGKEEHASLLSKQLPPRSLLATGAGTISLLVKYMKLCYV